MTIYTELTTRSILVVLLALLDKAELTLPDDCLHLAMHILKIISELNITIAVDGTNEYKQASSSGHVLWTNNAILTLGGAHTTKSPYWNLVIAANRTEFSPATARIRSTNITLVLFIVQSIFACRGKYTEMNLSTVTATRSQAEMCLAEKLKK